MQSDSDERENHTGLFENKENDNNDNFLAMQCDRIVFACPAPVALSILGDQASWSEVQKTKRKSLIILQLIIFFWKKWALGGVKLYKDVTYTHRDENYMKTQVV